MAVDLAEELADTLRPEAIRFELKAHDKEGVIREMLKLIHDVYRLSDRQGAYDAVMEREHSMSTGMEHGVALPHGKTSAVTKIVAAIGIHQVGIKFDSLDGLPCQIFVMVLSPPGVSGPHVRFLGAISHVLNAPEKRQAILQAKNPQEIITILSHH